MVTCLSSIASPQLPFTDEGVSPPSTHSLVHANFTPVGNISSVFPSTLQICPTAIFQHAYPLKYSRLHHHKPFHPKQFYRNKPCVYTVLDIHSQREYHKLRLINLLHKVEQGRRPSTFLYSHSPAPSIIITAPSQQHSTHIIFMLTRPPLRVNQSINPRVTINMTRTPPSSTIISTTTTTKPSFLFLQNPASGYQAPSNYGRNSESCMKCGGTSFDSDATKTWCRGCGKIQ
jgi:hypothetical protein